MELPLRVLANLGLAALVVVGLVRLRRMGWRSVAGRALKGLDRGQRQEVFRAIRTGEAVTDPRLASRAAAYAAWGRELGGKPWERRLTGVLWILWWGAALVRAVMLERAVTAAIDGTVLAASIVVGCVQRLYLPRAARAEIANRRLAEASGARLPEDPPG